MKTRPKAKRRRSCKSDAFVTRDSPLCRAGPQLCPAPVSRLTALLGATPRDGEALQPPLAINADFGSPPTPTGCASSSAATHNRSIVTQRKESPGQIATTDTSKLLK